MVRQSIRVATIGAVYFSASALLSWPSFAQVRAEPMQLAEASENLQLGAELLRLSDRIAALERLVSQLVGQQDETERSLRQVSSDFARFKADAEVRFTALEVELATYGSEEFPLENVASAQIQEVPASAVDRFEQGMSFVDREQWPEAEMAFGTFIATRQGDERIPQAKYHLGLAYLEQEQPAQAARVFLDLFETGEGNPFGVENLFALSRALERLDPENTDQLCSVFSEIRVSYGDVLTLEQSEALLDKQLDAGC